MAEASCSPSRDFETKTEIEVVPWYNVEQFQKVYDHIFCPSIEKKSWAIDQITIWRLKCTSLPVGVEATFSLVSCVIQDIIWTNKTLFQDEKDIRTMYGTALVRFVHLMCDKSYRKERLINVAKKLRIPTYIIDLRNEINHENVPSLANLRLGIEAALEYLKKSYWEKQASRMRKYIKKPIDVTDLRNLFCKYISCQLHILFERERLRVAEQDSQADVQLEIILREMEKWIINHKRLFIQVLVSGSIFIPRDEDFKELVVYHDFAEFQSNKNTFTEDSETALFIPDVPIYHQELWYDVIKMMNEYDIVPLFLEALLRTQADKTVIGQKLIISWAMQILKLSSISSDDFRGSCLYRIFKKKGIIVNWKSLFYSAVINPSIYVRSLLPMIFPFLGLDNYRKGRVMMLLGIYFGEAMDLNCAPSNKLFTVEDLRIAKRKQEEERQKRAGTFGKSIWSFPEDDSYKALPLGAIIPEDDEEDEEPQEEEAQEEEDCEGDFFVKDEDYVEKYFHNNANVKEEESFAMETDDESNAFEQEIEEEFKKRATLLYSY